MQDSRWSLKRPEKKRRITSVHLLVTFLLMQETAGFLGCRCTLPPHIELLIYQHSHMWLILRAALNTFSAQPVFVLGIVLIQRQDLAYGLAVLHEVHKDSSLKAVQVLLDGIPSLQSADHTTQLGAVSNLAESVPDLMLVSLTKMLKSASPNSDP